MNRRTALKWIASFTAAAALPIIIAPPPLAAYSGIRVSQELLDDAEPFAAEYWYRCRLYLLADYPAHSAVISSVA